MSSSTHKPQFLLDENVRKELFTFLKEMGIPVRVAPKGASDETLAKISYKEKCVIITNDADFSEYSENAIFAVVWLRIPQSDPQSLLKMFAQLLKKCGVFKGKLIILERNTWKDWPLSRDEALGKK
ncbi:DUF5615 family PIN-like protein [Patescibacteria group bacterium]|nr:DUF5615 family PIN-like protein [Patescibacteria group bacterium]MCL5010473.1 DUF5615 family PIN-like protein [Patescibacteria group bacterium]